MTKEELEEIKAALLRRDEEAVDERNNGRYPGIEGKLEFVAGRAEDALLFLNLVLKHLIDPTEPLKNETRR